MSEQTRFVQDGKDRLEDAYRSDMAASIPMLLDEAVQSGQLERGQIVSMTTFGSGFTWSSAVARW